MNLFIPNPHLEAELAHSHVVAEEVKKVAEKMADYARAIAPVESGAYRDSIHVETTGDDVGVVAGTDHAVYVEFGTSDTPAFAPLRRAAEAARR